MLVIVCILMVTTTITGRLTGWRIQNLSIFFQVSHNLFSVVTNIFNRESNFTITIPLSVNSSVCLLPKTPRQHKINHHHQHLYLHLKDVSMFPFLSFSSCNILAKKNKKKVEQTIAPVITLEMPDWLWLDVRDINWNIFKLESWALSFDQNKQDEKSFATETITFFSKCCFQLRKQLYIHKCLLVCVSRSKTPSHLYKLSCLSAIIPMLIINTRPEIWPQVVLCIIVFCY